MGDLPDDLPDAPEIGATVKTCQWLWKPEDPLHRYIW